MFSFVDLPEEVYEFMLKSNYISLLYISRLARTNHELFEKFIQNLNEKKEDLCWTEIERNWNNLVPDARYEAREKKKEYKCDCGWQVTLDNTFLCVVNPKEYHSIKITYVHNPRDIDLLTWYLNNEKIGYSML
jgi:hypothetical protein